MIRQKDGYKKNLRKRKNQNRYKRRLKNKMKRVQDSFILSENTYYGKSKGHPSYGLSYTIGKGRYFKILDSEGVIKIYENHSYKYGYRQSRQMKSQLTRTRLKRLGDIKINNKIWKQISPK